MKKQYFAFGAIALGLMTTVAFSQPSRLAIQSEPAKNGQAGVGDCIRDQHALHADATSSSTSSIASSDSIVMSPMCPTRNVLSFHSP